MKKILTYSGIIFFLGGFIFYKQSFFADNFLTTITYTQDYFQSQPNHKLSWTSVFSGYQNHCHQQGLPCSSIPQQNSIADKLLIQTIQNAGQTQKDDYSQNVLNQQFTSITQLSPYRKYPYLLGQQVLPIPKEFAIDENTKRISRNKAIQLGEQSIVYLCPNLKCPDHKIAEILAFNYFYYLEDGLSSSEYYEIAAQTPGAPTSLKNMATIVLGRAGFHSKSATLRYTKYLRSITENFSDEEQNYFLQQSITEYTLDLISKTDNQQNTCIQDLICLQKKGYLAQEIQERIDACQNSKKTTNCTILQLALQHNFIKKNGTLIYPIDSEMTYARRPDYQDRRIMFKNDLKNQ